MLTKLSLPSSAGVLGDEDAGEAVEVARLGVGGRPR